MSKNTWIRVGLGLAAGATVMAWGCTNGWGWWWPGTLIATGVGAWVVGQLVNPNA